MAEAFLRYYVRHLPYHQWQSFWGKVPDLQEWKLTQGWKFNYEQSYGYAPGTNVHEVAYAKRKCDAVIEHHDPVHVAGSSHIWKGGQDLPMTVLDDILVVLSIASSRYVHALLREYFSGSNGTLRTYATCPEPDTQSVIQEEELGNFVSEALSKLQTPGWLTSSGFEPAVHWFYQAQLTLGSGPSVLEMAMDWVTLEVLARAKGLKGYKKTMVSDLLANQGFTGPDWAFLHDALSDWYKVRNAAFHQGQQPSWPAAYLRGRLKQLREFAGFVFADLLVPQEATWKSRIASRLRGYHTP